MPNPDDVVPSHFMQPEPSSFGMVPGRHGSQADWAAFVTRPAPVQVVHGAPSELTLPVAHRVHSSCDRTLAQFVSAHCVPLVHLNGMAHDVRSDETRFGAEHA